MCLKKILGICFSVVVWNARISWACIVVVALSRSYKPNTTAFSTFYLCYSYLFMFCFRFFHTSFHANAKFVCVFFLLHLIYGHKECFVWHTFLVWNHILSVCSIEDDGFRSGISSKWKKTQKNHCKYEGVPPILITIYCLTFCTKFSFTMFEWW